MNQDGGVSSSMLEILSASQTRTPNVLSRVKGGKANVHPLIIFRFVSNTLGQGKRTNRLYAMTALVIVIAAESFSEKGTVYLPG